MNHEHQLTLPLPPPPADANTPLVPARMVNEWVYCPRLAYLEWVEGEWAETGDTAQGRRTHVRVDEGGGRLRWKTARSAPAAPWRVSVCPMKPTFFARALRRAL